MQVLLIDDPTPGTEPGPLTGWLTEGGYQVAVSADYQTALQQLRCTPFDALVLPVSGAHDPKNVELELLDLLRTADAGRVATLVLSDTPVEHLLHANALADLLPTDTNADQLCSRLGALRRCQELVRNMERELDNMERIGKRLNRHFSQVDQEMQLAGRLQRDFLPQTADPIGPITFSTVFRPASWVSGDIYDVLRVDEKHLAFYVADAVGHGMAASLLTMFIKKAIVSKRVFADGYEILTPSETLKGLNDALSGQALPNCQFVTACYCLINIETLQMQYARGGHPYPLLLGHDAGIIDLKSSGGLLGVFPGEEFPSGTIQLKPGDKIVIYTDGLETAFDESADPDNATPAYHKMFMDLASCPLAEFAPRINALLDGQTGSLNPMDDITIVSLEVDPDATIKATT
ncbi:MAG: PP2C family protein-serine/threonine phosphatase [Phycisphaerae bacterium]